MNAITSQLEDHVLTVTINRAAKKNAMTLDMWRAMTEIYYEASRNDDVSVVVLTGAGDVFSSGADLQDVLANPEVPFSQCMQVAQDLVRNVFECSRPTIAAVDGVAAGAGANLALLCDFVVASDRASFSQLFVKRGLAIDFGGAWMLPRLVGLARAKELSMLGEDIDAVTAKRYGLIVDVVAPELLNKAVQELAANLQRVAPLALRETKRLMNESHDFSFEAMVEREVCAQTALVETLDFKEGVASFMEKREPHFLGK